MNDPASKLYEGLGLTETFRILADCFAAGGIEQADAEARRMVLACTKLTHTALITQPAQPISAQEAATLQNWCARRLAGEPVTRIIGEREFWTLTLRVMPHVLDPRADSETIVETALDLLGERRHHSLRILDLGTGSGALLLALLAECPASTGIGVDLSPHACALAKDNAEANGLASRCDIHQRRWAEGLEGYFDIIVSNPPYIETATIAGLDREVRNHDPMLALDGGTDGLDAYREIIASLPKLLVPNGIAVLELGVGQAGAVSGLAEAAGLEMIALRPDLGGVERALALTHRRG